MTSNDLRIVLIKLCEAGGSRVPAEKTGWSIDMVPAINRAITMQYVTLRYTKFGPSYSLTNEGYKAIGRQSKFLSITEMIKLMFNQLPR